MKYLLRWQADALMQSLWATYQPNAANWQNLTPKRVQTTPNAQPIAQDKISGRYYLRSSSKNLGPRYLPVTVPELPQLGIEKHSIALMYSEYEKFILYLASESPALFKTLIDYKSKSRLSSVWWSTKDHGIWTVRRSKHSSKDLAELSLLILDLCQNTYLERYSTVSCINAQKELVSGR